MQFGRKGKRTAGTKRMPQCMENIDLIPPYNRARILLAYSSVLEWTAEELQRLVRAAERQIRCRIPKGARMKESLNHRDLHGIGTLASSRFLLELLGMLTNALDGQGCYFTAAVGLTRDFSNTSDLNVLQLYFLEVNWYSRPLAQQIVLVLGTVRST